MKLSKVKVIISIMISCVITSCMAVYTYAARPNSISDRAISGIIITCIIMFVVMGVCLKQVINNNK